MPNKRGKRQFEAKPAKATSGMLGIEGLGREDAVKTSFQKKHTSGWSRK
ncbi:MAG TPA: hypothetical protein VGI81_29030 [Tepidisphaeraceae bacterium]